MITILYYHDEIGNIFFVGHYYYLEASDATETGANAKYYSAVIPIKPAYLKFYYHMYGEAISSLNVYQAYAVANL